MILITPSFSLHCYYVYDFENHYWILHIQYQFTIIICEVLLNTSQKKKKKKDWTNSISQIEWG